MRIFTDDYVVMDYETGGLSRICKRPVETGMLLFKDGEVKLHAHLVNPRLDGDQEFYIDLGAMNVHGIGDEMIEADGWHPKKCAATMIQNTGDLPLWGHNAARFDFPIMSNEARKFGLTPVSQTQWRDSAAFYKGWRLQKYPDQYPDLMTYMTKVLGIRRKGLLYNLPFLTKTLDLGVRMLDENGEKTDIPGEMVVLEVDPHLGVSDEIIKSIEQLGAHRAAFDCVVTHGLIQWIKRNIGAMIDPDDPNLTPSEDALDEPLPGDDATVAPKEPSLADLAAEGEPDAIDPEDEDAI